MKRWKSEDKGENKQTKRGRRKTSAVQGKRMTTEGYERKTKNGISMKRNIRDKKER